MKLIQQFLALAALFAATASAFAPAASSRCSSPRTIASMGLFDGLMDYFSDEAKAKREEEKQRLIEEQEEAYREVLARRRNPEAMDQYMEDRKERLMKYKGGDDTSETQQED